jgi:LysR family transcriptional activator of nhaA
MRPAFNYHHLHYFWVVAKEGSIARGAERLGLAVQTVSAQVRSLERSLGCALFKPAGRGLALTEAGVEAMRQADPIFQLGEALPAAVRGAAASPAVRLAVGISDALPKLVVRRLMHPVLAEPRLRLLCHEGEFEDLLGDLALHRLDIVLADRPAPANPNLRLYSHALGESTVAWYGVPRLAERARRGFPRSLAAVPLLLPTAHSAVRARLESWLEARELRPTIAGEFEDSALLKAFAADGMGVFPAAEWLHRELERRYGVRRIGECEGVHERFFAIGTEKKVAHPLVQRLLAANAAGRKP